MRESTGLFGLIKMGVTREGRLDRFGQAWNMIAGVGDFVHEVEPCQN